MVGCDSCAGGWRKYNDTTWLTAAILLILFVGVKSRHRRDCNADWILSLDQWFILASSLLFKQEEKILEVEQRYDFKVEEVRV